MRVAILEFLDSDVFSTSRWRGCTSFLDPVIEFWDIDLRTFALEIGLNLRLAPQSIRRFEFVERPVCGKCRQSPHWKSFSQEYRYLSGNITGRRDRLSAGD